MGIFSRRHPAGRWQLATVLFFSAEPNELPIGDGEPQ
jgi:hypothetical protein